jgi:hypothetical protein
MPSPATPTEETRRVLSERMIVNLWGEGAPNVRGALSDAYDELSIDGQREVMRFARAIEQAVLAALPRGEVSEALTVAQIRVIEEERRSALRRWWSNLSDEREEIEVFREGYRNAFVALGLSRGGGDGEAVIREREREAVTEAVEYLSENGALQTGSAQQWTEYWARELADFRDREYPPAPAPVVRSVTVGGVRIRYEGGVWHADCDWPNVTAQHRTTHNAHLHNVLREYELWPTDAELRELLALPVEASDAAR